MKKITEFTKVLVLICISIISLTAFKSDPPANNTAKVAVSIVTKNKQNGKIRIALCNDEATFMQSIYKEGIIDMPIDGPANYTFENIPKGTYAIRLYQDTDGDGKLTSNNNGIPKEPFGFSQNPSMRYGPPNFKQASFEVKANVNLTISMVKFEL
jgi:uncharacterized protein (DUF2141 family)